jgi:hypothetical protein
MISALTPEYAAATVFFSITETDQVLIGRWAKTLASGETGNIETLLRR